jgi:apolipoprotein N-acyltransferase
VREHSVPLLVGSPAYAKWSSSARWFHERYNSAVLLIPGRSTELRYDKVHRVPYGEYLPWVEGRPWRLAAPICFEDVMTYVPRKMVWDEKGKKRVDVLVNISNDGWFAGTAQAPQHEQIARFRCIENRVPMARAVNTGISGFIDSAGRIIARVAVDGRTQEVAGVATARVMRDDRVTVYGALGDSLAVGCVVASFVLLAMAAADRVQKKERRTWKPTSSGSAV